jgi:glycosyltransferase involved in cell wall biosynthesis
MRVAYLVNQYPKVSHTFIRREIRALEQQGVHVERFSIRPPESGLVDPEDLADVPRTRVILGVGIVGLFAALLGCFLSRPGRFFSALGLTLRIGWVSERGLGRNLAYLAEACVLVSWLSRSGVEHVHAHFGTNSTAVAMLCHALGGPAYSFTAHGPEEFDKPLSLCLRDKIERASFVVAISSYGRSQLYRHCGHRHWSKIHLIHCGIDAEFLDAKPEPLPDAPRLVSVGRLNEQKGQLLLVEALIRLKDEGVRFELVLVGDGEMRAEIETSIAGHGLSERIRITGWASSEVVKDEINRARALILPSFAEGLPVVIMEALALGRPVLSTYVAGIPELVVNGSSGWLVPAGSVDHLTAALKEVLSTPLDELRRLGTEGARRVRESHDVTLEAGRLAKLFVDYGKAKTAA